MGLGQPIALQDTINSMAVIENQAAYVAGWLKKLRDDRKLLIHAAAKVQRAAAAAPTGHSEPPKIRRG
jgi:antirestriction protein ArdC